MTAEPGQVPLDDILQAVLLVMGALGFLSLAMSAFLVINTVSALLTQQKRQIGVMKAIGARTRQLLGMYVVMVCCYGALALTLSVPLTVVGSRALARYMAAQFNFDLTRQDVSSQAFLVQLSVGLLLPILASLYPFLSTLRLSAAEAMSDYGLGQGQFGAGRLDRLLSGTVLWSMRQTIVRPIVLSLRNTFRHKGRLALTLTTLTLASAIFVSVFSLRASLLYTVDELLQMWSFDVWITFSRPYRIERIRQETAGLPGVTATDVWIQIPARRIRPDGSESGSIYLFGPRADSDLAVAPAMVRGRWLLPEDQNALVVSTTLLQKEPDIDLGDEVILKMNGREEPWRVVGVSAGFLLPMVYANCPYVARVTGRVGQADAVLVATVRHDQAYTAQKAAQIEKHLKHRGLNVSSIQTTAAERGEADAAYGIIINLLMIMALLLAVVGGLGLAGTTSINVLEQRREIGVLRAIGAPGWGVAQVFILEGTIVGMLSWLLGAIIALPLSRLLGDAIGNAITGSPLTFAFSTVGIWLWLGVVILLCVAASFVPARNASQLTVREVLAYE
jgi:putative ABC transport system permease protein